MTALSSRKRTWYEGVTVNKEDRKVLKVVSMGKDCRSSIAADLHPHEFVLKKLRAQGVEVTVRSYDELDGFFHELTEAEIEAYCLEVIDAVRNGDVDQLRKLNSEGKPLKCSNRFGESLLHLACRKQGLGVVDFLLNEAGLSPAVRDDYGRTPLHDACWTPVPNFLLVDMIVKKCPDLLYIKDRRGHTPLFYARQNHWEQWIRHLEGRIETLAPTHSQLRKDVCG